MRNYKITNDHTTLDDIMSSVVAMRFGVKNANKWPLFITAFNYLQILQVSIVFTVSQLFLMKCKLSLTERVRRDYCLFIC